MKRTAVLLLCLLLLTLPVLAAESVTKTYTYTDANATVVIDDTFFAALAEEDTETDVNFEIVGEGLRLFFTYDNLYRNIDKYEDFTAAFEACTVTEAEGCPDALRAICTPENACLLDFRDGEHYPGVAELEAVVGAPFADRCVCVYLWLRQDDGSVLLGPVADGVTLGDAGQLSLTVTESQDYLVIDRSVRDENAGVFRALTPDIIITQKTALVWWQIVLIVAGGLLLLAVVALLVVLLLRRHNRKALARLTDGQPKTAPKTQEKSKKNLARRKKAPGRRDRE